MKVIAVTNRCLCKEHFLKRLERISKAEADYIILREKDLEESEYFALAEKCLKICGDKLIINSRAETAKTLGINKIQLSYSDFLKYKKEPFEKIGVSVHSLEEAKKAADMNADFIVAGHIFKTDCKKGVEPRGVDFIKEIAESVNKPVFAIGGISPETAPLLKNSGVAGVCIMSGLMSGDNITETIEKIKKI
ncbi:MAG: thiamine phosphate synthase [Clostridiales bacterium]|nr:thiamine phosphate synthase [Clostridiales bacterium]